MARPTSLCLPAAVAALFVASAASAQTRTYDLGDRSGAGACTQTSAGVSGYGNTYTCAAQGTTAPSLKITAASTLGTATTSGFEAAALTDQGSSGLGIGSFTEGGLGASGTNGNHAVDNGVNAGTDLMILEFVGGAQVLSTVSFGWTSGDADFQVLRWAGARAPGAAATIGSALSAGWQLVSTVNGLAANAPYAVNAGRLSASYWAVGAYNPAFGNTAGSAVDGGDDRFKVRMLTAAAAPAAVVPEPSTYALFAAGLAGLAGLAGAARRRAAA